MPENIPIPGSNRAKLIAAGLRSFAEAGYDAVEVDVVAAEAGLTVGALYHQFRSKANFYGVLRDEMTQRIIDRMEAAAQAVAPGEQIRAGLLAAFDGALRIKAGKLISDPDPRNNGDLIASYLGQLAVAEGRAAPETLGFVLAAALRAALARAALEPDRQKEARAALEQVVR